MCVYEFVPLCAVGALVLALVGRGRAALQDGLLGADRHLSRLEHHTALHQPRAVCEPLTGYVYSIVTRLPLMAIRLPYSIYSTVFDQSENLLQLQMRSN